MAQYAPDCSPARTILVEHDITYDLYAQMLAQGESWETRRQYERWVSFETQAWGAVGRVVVMSEKDRQVAREMRMNAAREGLRAPVQVMEGNSTLMSGTCAWWDGVRGSGQ